MWKYISAELSCDVVLRLVFVLMSGGVFCVGRARLAVSPCVFVLCEANLTSSQQTFSKMLNYSFDFV